MSAVAAQNEATLELEELISASPEAVFDAWIDPEQLKLWFFGGPTHVSRAETEPKVGGKYVIVMSDAEKDWVHRGEYIEIDRPRRLVFTCCATSIDFEESLVSITLTLEGDKTRLRLVQERLPNHIIDGAIQGWTELFGKLEKLLA